MLRPRLTTVVSTAGRAELALSEVEGGQITLYGAEMLQGDHPLFIVEAELDALLLWQAAGDLVDVVALAGAGRTLPGQWLARLLPYTRIFAALDTDNAGTLNATRLAALSARIMPVRVPEGNDVTEYYQAGGDVGAWVIAVVGDDTQFPLRVVIPPEEARLPGPSPTAWVFLIVVSVNF